MHVIAPTQPIMDGKPFRRAAAMANGISRRTLDMWAAAGVVVQPVRTVFVDARIPDSLPLRAACVALVLPRGATVCRRTAAWLHGIDCRDPGQHDEMLTVECAVPRQTTAMRRASVRCYVAPLAEHDVEVVDGVPRTTALRTALDCARWLPRHMALGCIDALAHQRLVTVPQMATAIEDFRGDKYVDQARRLIANCEPKTESFGESWLRLRLHDAGFPRPEAQICLPDDGQPAFRLDLGWRDRRIAVEYDGEEFHSSDEQMRHDDWRRDTCWRRYRWQVVGVGRGLVLGRSMELELGVGEMLGTAPANRVRLW